MFILCASALSPADIVRSTVCLEADMSRQCCGVRFTWRLRNGSPRAGSGQPVAQDADLAEARVERWRARLAPWADQISAFRRDGFYERFPARGQIERVARLHRE